MSEAFIVVGLGYGDEGKGTVVDYLTREHKAHTVVRFNGGAQAAHNVITPNGKHHTFAQYGSGTLAGARTHLSRFFLFNPFDLALETRHLQQLGIRSPLDMLSISPDTLVTTPLHIAANQIKEEQRTGKHGTCGKGIGETQAIANLLDDSLTIRVKDLRWAGIIEAKLSRLSNYYASTLLETFAKEHGQISEIARAYRKISEDLTLRDDSVMLTLQHTGHTIIYEGAQGILLDQDVGFHPHTTWSRTTSHNAREILDGAEATVIGVTRPYMTRHGTGPMAGDIHHLDHVEPHNRDDGYQGIFRYGSWDAIAMDYAGKCDPPDAVAVTCLDHLDGGWTSVWSYNYLGDLPDLSPYFWADKKQILQIVPGQDRAHAEAITNRLWRCSWNIHDHGEVDVDYVVDAIGEVLHAPVMIQSFGPTHEDKRVRILA